MNMLKPKLICATALLLVQSLSLSAAEPEDYTRWVDPFIGTGGHGHTYPGASLPFGMVQLSPDTRNDNSWDSCAGYHYSDTSILGFSHTHLSGVGVPDYGDILVQPITGELRLLPGDPATPRSGYRSRFRHATEHAEPGYYTVVLDDYSVKAELTATDRVGFHRYTFENAGRAQFLIDLIHRDPVTESFIHIISNHRIEGFRRAKFWAGDQRHYFALEFSRPVSAWKLFENRTPVASTNRIDGQALQAVAVFDSAQADEAIEIKVATSAVSAEGAWRNLEAEGQDLNFDQARQSAKAVWNRSLSKIEIEGSSPKERSIFYTALYHALLTPNLYEDADGRYRGMDGAVHQANGFTNYTVFSLWDTFRALHPLLTIIEPQRDADFVKTLVNMSQLFGELPMWELAANDTRCMIGYHAVPVIADAWAKGITNFDLAAAFVEMKRTALLDKRGLLDYRTLGYVPANKGSQAVSKTLEYAYDDWCIAQTAKVLGKQADYEYFLARSQFYRNLFDPSVGFMRGKTDAHEWSTPFNPQATGLNYTEGNAYQYSLFVPQDTTGLTELLGGKAGLARYLDTLFTQRMTLDLGDENDISGLIGQYAHGNEPSHHLAYFYCFAGQPAKTQAMVRRILTEQYSDSVGGLDGNEDCGQMSAWYILSALGFYPVCPGQPDYILGSPLFNRAVLRLDNGKTFTLSAPNNQPDTPYIQSATLNENPFSDYRLSHFTLISGGELRFQMGRSATNALAATRDPAPIRVTPPPYLLRTSDKFLESARVELRCDDPGAEIFYSLKSNEPPRTPYTAPFDLTNTTTLNLQALKPNAAPSILVTRNLTRSQAIVPAATPRPGLAYRYYEGIYRSVYDFAKDPVAASGIVDRPTVEVRQRENWLALAFDGLIQIPRDGEYTFYVAAKDGGQLQIDGEEQFESDGRKDQPLPQQATLALRQGFHRFTLKFYKCTDEIALTADWSGPGFPRTAIPKKAFFHIP
jgi:predicted alpha-1,2-mannosidase